MKRRRLCLDCERDGAAGSECYPVATCGCYVCEDVVAEEEGYPLYRPLELDGATRWVRAA